MARASVQYKISRKNDTYRDQALGIFIDAIRTTDVLAGSPKRVNLQFEKKSKNDWFKKNFLIPFSPGLLSRRSDDGILISEDLCFGN